MLRFTLLEPAGSTPASSAAGAFVRLDHAHLFGIDDIPVPGEVTRDGQTVRCEPSSDDPAGLRLQVNLDDRPADRLGPLGAMTLQTCLLPGREQPYLLSLELARHRVMQVFNKLEDWALFVPGEQDEVLEAVEQARALFMQAVVSQRDPSGAYRPEAEALARSALAAAVDAGERLAIAASARDVPERVAGRMYVAAAARFKHAHGDDPPPGIPILTPALRGVVLADRPQVGVAIDPRAFNEPLASAVQRCADFVSIPMRWNDMEPAEGELSFRATDRWIEWAVRSAKLPVHAGPVIDFRPECVPEWLYIWENDYETLRELVYEHVRQIVTRYRRTVRRWTIASGLHVNRNIRLSFDQMMDLTRIAVLMVKKLHPQAKVQLEIVQPFGGYYAKNRNSLPPTLYADMAVQGGLAVDAFSIKLQVGSLQPGQTVRDLMQLSGLLDRFADYERPIAVTIGCPAEQIEPDAADKPAAEPGVWREPWTADRQAEWLRRMMAACLSKPYVTSVTWHQLADGPGRVMEMPAGGLLDAKGQPRPSLMAMSEIRRAVREGRSPVAMPPVAAG